MEASTFRLCSEDGLELHVYRWLPSAAGDDVKAVLQIAHGMGEHAGRYAELAEHFTAAGWAVYANDHRGHGESLLSGGLGHMGDDRPWERAVGDVHRLAAHVADAHSDAPLVLLGHSMGSFMAQQALVEQPEAFDAVALSASNGRPPPVAQLGRLVARLERVRQGKEGHSPVINSLSFADFNKKFAPTRTDFDWLSRASAEVDKYIDDPLCGFIGSNASWVGMLDALPTLTDREQLERIPKNKPVYCFAGTHDAVGEFGKGMMRLVQAYRGAWLTEVEHKLYPGGRHEMLHEVNGDEVMGDLLAWCERAVATVPGG